MKIAIIGGPGSGKTTTCKLLAQKLIEQGYPAVFEEESARRWIKENQCIPSTLDQKSEIIKWQSVLERNHLGKILILDANIYSNLIYFFMSLDWSDIQDVHRFSDYVNIFMRNTYDYIFFMPNFIWYRKDGERSQPFRSAWDIGWKIKHFLDILDIDYHFIKSITKQGRVNEISKVISKEKGE